jgi:predicted phosphoribosyltransferase
MFYDRYEAGRDVAEQLTQYAQTDAIICTIPRGGILTGIAVAKRLQLPLEIMVVGKVEHVVDDSPIYGAVTEYKTQSSQSDILLPEAEVQAAVAETQQKRKSYTDSDILPNWADKTVIVVDDGAESGLTIKAVIEALQEQKAAKIIAALPAASASITKWLNEEADEVVVVTIEPEFTGAIEEHYSHYPEVFDKEVHVAYWHAKHMYDQQSK